MSTVDFKEAPTREPGVANESPKVPSKAAVLANKLRELFGGDKKNGDGPHVDDVLRQVAQGDVGQEGGKHRAKNERFLDRFRKPTNEGKHRAQPSESDGRQLAALKSETTGASVGVSLRQREPGAIPLADLRDPARVGSDKYGDSLVNVNHKGKNTPVEHEAAQAVAYAGLQEKIDRGIVDPSAIAEEIGVKLGVASELQNIPDTYDGIVGQVNQEVRRFLEQSNLNEAEAASIEREVVEFAKLYGEAYGTENVPKAYELVRDNARKLSYQAAVDKDVFSGSDHGTRHILDGNTKFAMQMVDSLRVNGLNVSAKDQILMHQIMIDHDLGYTTGAAQAERGYFASKDHPLVSAKFIEDNEGYYVDKFGADGYKAIFDSVLNHSYPRLEYQSDETDGVHADLIRGITSTVDSLGVTVETKTPEFFWNPDAMRVLLKIRLAAEVNDGKTPTDLMEKYKGELLVVASQEPNQQRQDGYKNAINSFFSEVTANNTLGHYTGVVRGVSVEPVPHDTQTEIMQDHDHAHGEHDEDHSELAHQKLRVVVQITPTEVYALLGNMFGDKDANQSFMKAMQDLGLDTSQLGEYGRAVTLARMRQEEAPQALDVAHDSARVSVDNQFLEDLSPAELAGVIGADKIQAISEVFHEVHLLSVRTEINQLLDQLKAGEGQNIGQLRALFLDSVTEKTSPLELQQLQELIAALGNLESADTAKQALKGFLTSHEKTFLGVE
ncbi:hypothetical protein HY945_01200 [Candidatus Gottesmanbacteria bacterium]|nr:hypothetical protein [Candidatus Gottesmanbacteria bacterium]